MKVKSLLIIILILAGLLVSFAYVQQQQAERSAQADRVLITSDDPAIIESVTVEEEFANTEKVGRTTLYPGYQLEALSGALYQPSNMRVVNDRIYILDQGNNRVIVCDLKGNLLRQIGDAGQGPGEFLWPVNFAVSWTGEVCILTNDATGVFNLHVFDHEGWFTQRFQLDFQPQSLAINSKQEILLSAPDEQALIKVYSFRGQLLRKFGSPQHIPEAESQPKLLQAYNRGHLYVDRLDKLYIAFVTFPLVRIYEADGKVSRQIKVQGREINQLIEQQRLSGKEPHLSASGKSVSFRYLINGLAIDPQGNLWLILGDRSLYVYSQFGELKQVRSLELDQNAIQYLDFDDQGTLYGLNMLRGVYVFEI